jgi:hypothetical protein
MTPPTMTKPSAPPRPVGIGSHCDQQSLDDLMRIAVWEIIWGGGSADALGASVSRLLAAGAQVLPPWEE